MQVSSLLLSLFLTLHAATIVADPSPPPCSLTPISFQNDFKLSKTFERSNIEPVLWAAYVAEMQSQEQIAPFVYSWGFRDLQFLGSSVEGATAFLAETDEYRVLVFRGSTTLLEKAIDTLFVSRSFANIGLKGRGHTGMNLAFKFLWPAIQTAVTTRERVEAKPLVIIGHSLGGALGLMHAVKLAEEGVEINSVYSSGQPRIGNYEFYKQVYDSLGSRYYRIENGDDYTSKIPPSAGAAESFAQLLFTKGTWAHEQLMEYVEEQNYALPRSVKLELEPSLPLSQGRELRDEIDFWSGVKEQLISLGTLKDFVSLAQEQAKRHPPQAYLCYFLSLSES